MDGLVFPRQFVRGTPVNLLRGECRRSLLNLAGELRREALQLRGVERGSLIGPERLAIRIVGVGSKTKSNRAGIAFAPVRVKARQPGGASESKHQNSGGQWIERAQVSDLPEAHQPPHKFHYVMRCFSLRLVDHKHSINRRCCRHSGHAFGFVQSFTAKLGDSRSSICLRGQSDRSIKNPGPRRRPGATHCYR